MKRIRRNYRMNPMIDRVIKLMAESMLESEADVITYCVMLTGMNLVRDYRMLDRIGKASDVPPEFRKAFRAAQVDYCTHLLQGIKNNPNSKAHISC